MANQTLRVLLTNDDGIDAPGLRALNESVLHAVAEHHANFGCEIVVVAPNRCRSECGHSIETSRPLSIQSVQPNWHSVDGTPVDCVRVAVQAMGFRPHLVFSGINAGANLGINLMVSGTFAAAREANLLGLPACAVSHYRRPDVQKRWEHTPEWLSETIREFIDHCFPGQCFPTHCTGDGADEAAAVEGGPSGLINDEATLWNVNLPAIQPREGMIPQRVVCDVDRCPIDRTGRIEQDGKVRFELDFHARPREPGKDVEKCFSGHITISKLRAHWGL